MRGKSPQEQQQAGGGASGCHEANPWEWSRKIIHKPAGYTQVARTPRTQSLSLARSLTLTHSPILAPSLSHARAHTL